MERGRGGGGMTDAGKSHKNSGGRGGVDLILVET